MNKALERVFASYQLTVLLNDLVNQNHFSSLCNITSEETIPAAMPLIEQYVVLVYDRTSTCTTADDDRRYMFTHNGMAIEYITPTSVALLQHVNVQFIKLAFAGANIVGSYSTPSRSIIIGMATVSKSIMEPVWTFLPQAQRHA